MDIWRKLIIIFSANMIAAIFSLLLILFIARVYDPGALGLYQLIVMIVMYISTISGIKYDMAIMLPKYIFQKKNLLLLVQYISVFFVSGYLLLSYFTKINVWVFGADINNSILITLGFYIIIFANFTFYFNYALALNMYKLVGITKVIQSVAMLIFVIIFSFYSLSGYTIIYAGMFSFFLILIFLIYRLDLHLLKAADMKIVKGLAYKYRLLPKYEFPWAIANQFSVVLPIVFITKYFSLQELGVYTLASRLIDAPIGIIITSYSQVYFREAAHNAAKNNHQDNKSLFFKMVLQLTLIGVCVLCLSCLSLNDSLVSVILGDKWTGIGWIIIILALGRFFQLVVSPITSTYTIYGMQRVSVILGILSLIIRASAMYIFSYSMITMLIAYTTTFALFYIIYALIAYYLVKRGKVGYYAEAI